MQAATMTESRTESQTCPHCHGKGGIGICVNWSDGMGCSSRTCPVCDGRKLIDFDPVTELAAIKTRLEGFLYTVWLVAGCKVKPSEPKRYDPAQESRNKVLLQMKEFPVSTPDIA